MNIHTYLEKRASKAEKIKDYLRTAGFLTAFNAMQAGKTFISPIKTYKESKELLKMGPSFAGGVLLTTPGMLLGYSPYAYATYKGGKKIKDYIKDKKRGK